MVERLDGRDVSLDRPAHAGATAPLIDSMVGSADHERDLLLVERGRGLNAQVAAAVATLDARERYIAEHRLMADTAEELSLADISRHMGISRERARQLEVRTKRKLRAHLAAWQTRAG
jgi:RNA polymerase sigma-32 factor